MSCVADCRFCKKPELVKPTCSGKTAKAKSGVEFCVDCGVLLNMQREHPLVCKIKNRQLNLELEANN